MGIKLLVAAGTSDRKLYSKIVPLLENDVVERLYLVRPRPFISHPKSICYYPKSKIWKNKLSSEFYRIFNMIIIILTCKPDLLIGIGMIPHGIFINILGKIFRKKTIVLLMGKNDLFLTYPDRKIKQKILLNIAKWAEIIGTRGTCSKEWLITKGVPEEKIFIPHNVFDFNEFTKLEQEKKYDLIYVGLYNYYKRIDLLIDVVERLVKKYRLPNIKMGIIGTVFGNEKIRDKMISYALQKGLKNNIDFLKSGDTKYLNNLLNQSKVFIMTSQGDGLPMVIVEALSCGLPIAIFDDADIADICKHGYNSMISPLWDIDTMSAHVYQMLTDEVFYKKLAWGASNFRKEKEKEYSLENCKNIWGNMLKKIGAVRKGVC